MLALLLPTMMAAAAVSASPASVFLDSFPSSSGSSLTLSLSSIPSTGGDRTSNAIDPCTDDKSGQPVSCVPDFVNAAYGVRVEPAAGGQRRPQFAQFLTDLHNPANETCWKGDFGAGENVSLTVSLRKKFELTYVSLHFCGGHSKPRHMAIHKSMDHGKTWQPFQYYSSDCLGTFERREAVGITRANEQEALCVDSHLGPDAGTRIAFSTLAERPSAEDFEHSPVLQDWVTATDIRITFPAESDAVEEKEANATGVARLRRVIGVSDLAIGGRCKCNGHASSCTLDPESGEMSCECKHNTAGRECEKCKGEIELFLTVLKFNRSYDH